MRKQALVHLHQLCYLLAQQVEEQSDEPSQPLDSYHEGDVHPHAIHLDKQSHMKATAVLTEGIVRTIETHNPPVSGGQFGEESTDVVGESLN